MKPNPFERSFLDTLPQAERARVGEFIRKRDDARTDPVVIHATRELVEIRGLAWERWKERAFVDALKDGLGYMLRIGFYAPTDPGPSVPPWKRHAVVVACGRSADEVRKMLAKVEQAM